MENNKILEASQLLTDHCYEQAKTAGWWSDPKTGLSASRRVEKREALDAVIKLRELLPSSTHRDLNTIQDYILTPNRAEKLMLMVSEIAEAMEADRKDLMDDKIPSRKGIEVELADTLIRIFDSAGGLGLDVSGALVEKLEFNAKRADHKPENRIKEGGKSY